MAAIFLANRCWAQIEMLSSNRCWAQILNDVLQVPRATALLFLSSTQYAQYTTRYVFSPLRWSFFVVDSSHRAPTLPNQVKPLNQRTPVFDSPDPEAKRSATAANLPYAQYADAVGEAEWGRGWATHHWIVLLHAKKRHAIVIIQVRVS